MAKSEKIKIREEKIALRKKIPPRKALSISKVICGSIVNSEEYAKADRILLYKPVNNEVNTEYIEKNARKSGKIIAFPKCLGENELSALVPYDEESFVSGSYGISEPDEDRSMRIDPSKIDLVICPLTAFDENCRRLGMGKGYYDRYLAKCANAFVIGAAYECQKTGEVPEDETDIRLDAVFTEVSVYRRRM